MYRLLRSSTKPVRLTVKNFGAFPVNGMARLTHVASNRGGFPVVLFQASSQRLATFSSVLGVAGGTRDMVDRNSSFLGRCAVLRADHHGADGVVWFGMSLYTMRSEQPLEGLSDPWYIWQRHMSFPGVRGVV